MLEKHWQRAGGGYTLSWGDRLWRLEIDQTGPGLRVETDQRLIELLTLHGLAAVGRSEDRVFTSASLIGVEEYRSRIQATYAPTGWHGLIVRTAWGPSLGGAGIDLEVQANATSVGLLHDLEVMVQSRWQRRGGPGPPPAAGYWVLPRDSRSAALSYDGREPPGDLRNLVTLAVSDSPRCHLFNPTGLEDDPCYIEMVPPDDVARLIRIQSSEPEPPVPPPLTVRYGLFGHDFEKGVVFRGRLRGYWAPSDTSMHDANLLYEQFLSEPPPLGP